MSALPLACRHNMQSCRAAGPLPLLRVAVPQFAPVASHLVRNRPEIKTIRFQLTVSVDRHSRDISGVGPGLSHRGQRLQAEISAGLYFESTNEVERFSSVWTLSPLPLQM